MAGRLFIRSAARVIYSRRPLPPQHVIRGLASGGIPSDEEQATGLEKIVLQAAKKELIHLTF